MIQARLQSNWKEGEWSKTGMPQKLSPIILCMYPPNSSRSDKARQLTHHFLHMNIVQGFRRDLSGKMS